MTVTINVVQTFEVPTHEAGSMFQRCDEIMNALLSAEENDDSVRDAWISADAAHRMIEIGLVGRGEDEVEARARVLALTAATIDALGFDMHLVALGIESSCWRSDLAVGSRPWNAPMTPVSTSSKP